MSNAKRRFEAKAYTEESRPGSGESPGCLWQWRAAHPRQPLGPRQICRRNISH